MYNQSQCACQSNNQTQCGGGQQSPCTPPNYGPNCQMVDQVNTGSGQTFNQVIDVPGTQSQLTTTNYYNNCYRKINHYYVTDYKYNNNYYVEYNVYHRTPVNITNGSYNLGSFNIECNEGGNGGCAQPTPCSQQTPTNGGCTVTSRCCC